MDNIKNNDVCSVRLWPSIVLIVTAIASIVSVFLPMITASSSVDAYGYTMQQSESGLTIFGDNSGVGIAVIIGAAIVAGLALAGVLSRKIGLVKTASITSIVIGLLLSGLAIFIYAGINSLSGSGFGVSYSSSPSIGPILLLVSSISIVLFSIISTAVSKKRD